MDQRPEDRLRRIGGRIWLLPGSADTDRPHLAVIVGDRHTLMVDAGNSAAHAGLLLSALACAGLRPPDYLAITHWHWDHTFGAAAIPALMVAHPLVRERLAEMQTWAWDDAAMEERLRSGQEIEFCTRMIQKELPSREGLLLRLPDLTIAGEAAFDLGGVTCRLVPLPGDHGPDGIGVWVEEEGLLFAGDALGEDLYHGAPHYTRAGLGALLAALGRIPAPRVVSSHDDRLEPLAEVMAELLGEQERLE